MIGFRLDANASVATGHLYRCMAIARKLKEKNEESIFILAENLYTDLIEQNGFQYRVLDLKWDDWNDGIDKILLCLKEENISYLVVDSYRVTEAFFERMQEAVPVFYLDDICDTPYRIDAAMHYSEWPDEHFLENLYKGTDVKTYAGLEYVPLRTCFENVESKQDRKYDFLITTGGSDSYHITYKLLQKICSQMDTYKNLRICAVLGRFNEDIEKIHELIKEKENITSLNNVSNMDEIMANSRVALTAGGVSVYELMACSVPFVVFGFSDDQDIFGRKLEKYGICSYAGDARHDADMVVEKILEDIGRMLTLSFLELSEMAAHNKQLVDGKGASRIADVIMDLKGRNA